MIETNRLILTLATDAEMEQMIAVESDEDNKMAYCEILEGCRNHPEQREWYAVWLMKLKDSPDDSIGDLNFKGLSSDGIVEIGYGIKKEYEGNGYTTEAVIALVRWAASMSVVNQIEAETDPNNIASQRVLSKAGFIPNGVIGKEGPRFVWKS